MIKRLLSAIYRVKLGYQFRRAPGWDKELRLEKQRWKMYSDGVTRGWRNPGNRPNNISIDLCWDERAIYCNSEERLMDGVGNVSWAGFHRWPSCNLREERRSTEKLKWLNIFNLRSNNGHWIHGRIIGFDCLHRTETLKSIYLTMMPHI